MQLRVPRVILNLAIGLCAVLLVGEYLKTWSSSVVGHDKHSVGETVPWLADGKAPHLTVLVVLRAGCPFCSKSASFYRALLQNAKVRSDVRIIAVMPSVEATSWQYMKSQSLPFKEFRQGSPEMLGVEGTPALLLVDQRGIVRHSWLGWLDSSAEKAATKEIFD